MRQGKLLALGLLAAVLAHTGAQDISESEDNPSLTLGIYFQETGENVMSYEAGGGIWAGYEVSVLRQLLLVELSGYDIKMVKLPTLDSRLTELENGNVDFVMGLFAVTPARKQQVDFVKPYYYSSGSAIFGPGDGCIPGVESWADLNGTALAMRPGYYAEKQLLDLGVIPVYANGSAEVGELIADGEAEALVDNLIFTYKDQNLTLCGRLPSMWRVPAGIAVAKNNTQLNELLSAAMMRLFMGGQDAPIVKIEESTFGAAGVPPNPDIAALVADPDMDGNILNPED